MALPGVIWVVFLMSGVLGLEKSFMQEMETGCMGGLLLAPVERSVLFLGKMLANTLFLLISQLLFIPLCLFLFEIEVINWLEFLMVILFGTIGFSSLGTLLTAMTSTLHGKGMLLPILIFPLMVPSLLCVVRLTDFLFFGSHPAEVWSWWKLLIGFDVILFTISLLGFEFIVEE
jgi:heme exporter protein B